ncbi:MAG: OB-fold domain-containing protein [Mycoplasmoidaceae bacterium]
MEYIIGKINMITKDHIILENNNVGYKIIVNHFNEEDLNKEFKIYLIEKLSFVNSNIFKKIYGFLSQNEKELFEKIIVINGIGPKNAMRILEIEYELLIKNIIERNYDFFENETRLNSKIINLLLRNIKIDDQWIYKKLDKKTPSIRSSLIDSLLYLGYSKKEIGQMTSDLDYNNSIENLIEMSIAKITNKEIHHE